MKHRQEGDDTPENVHIARAEVEGYRLAKHGSGAATATAPASGASTTGSASAPATAGAGSYSPEMSRPGMKRSAETHGGRGAMESRATAPAPDVQPAPGMTAGRGRHGHSMPSGRAAEPPESRGWLPNPPLDDGWTMGRTGYADWRSTHSMDQWHGRSASSGGGGGYPRDVRSWELAHDGHHGFEDVGSADPWGRRHHAPSGRYRRGDDDGPRGGPEGPAASSWQREEELQRRRDGRRDVGCAVRQWPEGDDDEDGPAAPMLGSLGTGGEGRGGVNGH